jgi:hypothetical protein
MNEPTANPLIISLLCLARCLVPLILVLGISYLLRRFGFVAEHPKPPKGWENGNNNQEGGLSHGNA